MSRRLKRAGHAATTAGKKIKGRKRQILVDTEGRLLRVFVHPADWTDSEGGANVVGDYLPTNRRLRLIWADSAYLECRDWLHATRRRVKMQIAPTPKGQGFVVVARRWVVERTFAWLGRWRRLAKDYEFLPRSSQTWIYLVSARRSLARLSLSFIS